MKHPWKSLLEALTLDRRESDTIKRFLQDPEGKNFLPVVSILKAQAHAEEAFELLNWGVRHHPTYIAARVTLAKTLYERGLVHDCRMLLLNDTEDLVDNVMAQKLLFKTALLCHDFSEIQTIVEHMQKNHMLNPQLEALVRTLQWKGPTFAAEQLQEEFHQKGLALILPPKKPSPSSPSLLKARQPDANFPKNGLRSATLASFYAVPLEEVFGRKEASQRLQSTRSGLQMEGGALAEIYRKQGLYMEALAVYQNLLQSRPHDAELVQAFAATQAELDRQKQNNLTPHLPVNDNQDFAQNSELVGKITFYRNLLEKLKNDTTVT